MIATVILAIMLLSIWLISLWIIKNKDNAIWKLHKNFLNYVDITDKTAEYYNEEIEELKNEIKILKSGLK